MFKKIKFYDDGYEIRTADGRIASGKYLNELAKYIVENYVRPIEQSIKVWTHGKNYTGEIGDADYLMNRIDLSWNDCMLATGISGLIKRARRDGAMRLIKLIRQNPELLEYIVRKQEQNND